MKQGGSNTATIAPALTVVEPPPAHKEEIDDKLETAREQLLALRRQQEELERQKGDLEELRRRQDEYVRGKAEMIDSLTRGLVTLERDHVETQRHAELCGRTREAFSEYVEQLQDLNDGDWTSTSVRTELSRALTVIENARLEYNRARTKLDCLNPAADQSSESLAAPTQPKPFEWNEALRYLWIGAAASAPLIVAGTIWTLILLVARAR